MAPTFGDACPTLASVPSLSVIDYIFGGGGHKLAGAAHPGPFGFQQRRFCPWRQDRGRSLILEIGS